MSWKPGNQLYPYQQEAYEAAQEANVLLAYDMGTGKTPLSLAIIEAMRDQGLIKRPGLVLAPKSLLRQWVGQIEKFTDSTSMVIDGSPAHRVRLYESLYTKRPGYVLMTYDTYVRDTLVKSRREPPMLLPQQVSGFAVLDEATAIKSFRSQRSKLLKKHYSIFPIRLALTGTPIENGKLEELYSILQFVEPQVLGSYISFETRYCHRNGMGWIDSYRNLDEFHHKISGNVIRKKSSDPDVSAYMPKVVTMPPLMVTLDAKTRKVYESIKDDVLSDLDEIVANMDMSWTTEALGEEPWEQDQDHPDGQLMAKIQSMRMLLDTPEAVRRSAAQYARQDTASGSQYAYELHERGVLTNLTSTPKLDATMAYLEEFLERDDANKVVIFASFLNAVAAIKDRCDSAEIGAVTFTGAASAAERAAAVGYFQGNRACRVFISSDAGGYGLDLPQANLLINYDLPWQSGLLAQRNARIHRASSKWEHVITQDVIMAGTIEERLLQMHLHKISLSQAALDGENIADDGSLISTLESLRSFLAVSDAIAA